MADAEQGRLVPARGLSGLRPTCLAIETRDGERAWCGTVVEGVFRSDDGGRSWKGAGLAGERVTSVATSAPTRDEVWVGTEPSAVLRSSDAGASWKPASALDALPSSSTWSFPPRPDTHHVRWIALHPRIAGRAWVAVEAGALLSTSDGGRTWRDRVPGGPYDTHELAIHPERPETLCVAAGDGYFVSGDGGTTWAQPEKGLEMGYLRSVAIDPGDPEVALVSGASRARSTYVAGRSDGRVYRRGGSERWTRIRDPWPDPPQTIAPLLAPGARAGELWAADERGVHRSIDGGRRWERVAPFPSPPMNLRGLVVGGSA